ncbi:MAG: hypothetical protein ABSA46_12645 [Thermodesulfovibrionales bacterium]|jgi:hypothetical protein
MGPGRPSKGFKAEPFLTMARWKPIEKLQAIGNTVSHTYGFITKQSKIAMDLPKSHINDSFAVAGGSARLRRAPVQYFGPQVRKRNRKLRRGLPVPFSWYTDAR